MGDTCPPHHLSTPRMTPAQSPPEQPAAPAEPFRLRVDKWLWTARLFHTRALALEAVQGGHVRLNGAVIKPSKLIGPGDELSVWKSGTQRVLVVRATTTRRVPAREVPNLYEETAASTARREQEREQRRLAPNPAAGTGRPSKRQRASLYRLRRGPRAGE